MGYSLPNAKPYPFYIAYLLPNIAVLPIVYTATAITTIKAITANSITISNKNLDTVRSFLFCIIDVYF